MHRFMLRLFCGVFALLALPIAASASTVTITADFTPDTHNPGSRLFKNTTPVSGLCNSVHLNTCRARGIFSVDTGIRGTKTTIGSGNRNNFYFGMPGRREIRVQDSEGNSHSLILRITGMGFRYQSPNGSSGGPGMNSCAVVLTNYGAGTNAMRLFVRPDEGDSAFACWSGSVSNQADRVIHELDIVYSLETPDPFGMKSGHYRGETTYTVGDVGADIDLGGGANPDSNTLTLKFDLTVNHAFRLSFPPGSDRAVLAPVGGWSQWVGGGRPPSALRRDLPFSVSSSGRFTVGLACQIPSGLRCAIREQASGAQVPIDIAVTMPSMTNVRTGEPAVAHPLLALPVKDRALFGNDGYVQSHPSRLHFEVAGDPLRTMLSKPGTQWKGDVTVIFDAAP